MRVLSVRPHLSRLSSTRFLRGPIEPHRGGPYLSQRHLPESNPKVLFVVEAVSK